MSISDVYCLNDFGNCYPNNNNIILRRISYHSVVLSCFKRFQQTLDDKVASHIPFNDRRGEDEDAAVWTCYADIFASTERGLVTDWGLTKSCMATHLCKAAVKYKYEIVYTKFKAY